MNIHVAIVQAMDEMRIKQPQQVVEFCKLVEEKLKADNKQSTSASQIADQVDRYAELASDGYTILSDNLREISRQIRTL